MPERLCWALLALVHAVPAIAAFSPSLISRLYAIERGAPAFPLLQHRAALFGVIFIVCLWAMADPAVRRLATVAAAVSMGSFLLLYVGAGAPPNLRAIAIADAVGLVPLAYAGWRAFSISPAVPTM